MDILFVENYCSTIKQNLKDSLVIALTPETCSKLDEEKILKIAKEVVVKFIEIGRVSPTQFEGVFQSVFRTIKSSVSSDESED